ncbi:unnamed protein product, partial [Ectocarpus sp. 12 AP-2014]
STKTKGAVRLRRSASLASTSRTRQFSSKFPPVVSLSVVLLALCVFGDAEKQCCLVEGASHCFIPRYSCYHGVGHRCRQKTRGRLQNQNSRFGLTSPKPKLPTLPRTFPCAVQHRRLTTCVPTLVEQETK